MNVRIEIQENLMEEEVVIRTRNLDERTKRIFQNLQEMTQRTSPFVFFKENTEYYFPVDEILFFETNENQVTAHARDQIYETRYKLYELEELLPGQFMRVSKSAILNTNHIFSITKNLTASSIVQFQNTHKQVFVSRYYYKPLRSRLEEKRMNL